MLHFSRRIVFPFLKGNSSRNFSVQIDANASSHVTNQPKSPNDFEWSPGQFGVCPPNYWEDLNNQKKFLLWASNKLNIQNSHDWYKVTQKVAIFAPLTDKLLQDLKSLGGSGLLSKYRDSPADLISSVYSESEWLPWKFSANQKTYWDIKENQKKFFDYVAKELKINDYNDWYKVTKKVWTLKNICLYSKQLQDYGAGSLVKSTVPLSDLMSKVFPEYEWLPWKFEDCPKKYWDDVTHHRKFLDWFAKESNIADINDWYKVTAKDIANLGGSNLLSKYENSASLMLTSVYRDYPWLPWKFGVLQKSYWDDVGNQKRFLDWAAQELGVKDYYGWFKVSKEDFAKIGGPAIYSQNLRNVLSAVFEGPSKLLAKKVQQMMRPMLQVMFPNQELHQDYKHPDLAFPSGQNLEFDFLFPKINLAIDYLSEKHFSIGNTQESTLAERRNNDALKYDICRQNGITLIQIPHWWDRDFENLATTVYIERPELFSEIPKGRPIPPVEPTEQHKYSVNEESAMKKSLMTATMWEDQDDPTGWWMTEKFDGMRLLWNGSAFFTRQGKKLKVPEFISASMPKVVLDGELWTQYGLYQDSVQLSQSTDEQKWRKAVFWVFDAPEIGNRPYEERVDFLKELKKEGGVPDFVQIIETVQCKGRDHLKEYFKEIVAKGGEGVMLREPNSVYKNGRSKSLRKYKEYFDAEVKVIENAYPHGFNCLQTNGKNLFVNIHDNYQEAKAVKAGSIITVKHLGINIYGTLQYPKFFRPRNDVQWEDLIQQQKP